MSTKNTIARLSSVVIDTGRRGEPRPGCDCMQCFGYCIDDSDKALRDRALKLDAKPLTGRYFEELS